MNLLGNEKNKTFYFTIKVDYGAQDAMDAIKSYEKARKDKAKKTGQEPTLTKCEQERASSTWHLTYEKAITDKTIEGALFRVREMFVGSFYVTDVRTSYYGHGGLDEK